MGVQLFTNNASSTLASGILAGTTSIPLAPGTGALFPAITGTDYFYVTFDDGAGTREIVKVTARSTDTLTVTRAQEGTTASAFDAGDIVELRPTAAGLTNMVQKTGSTLTIDDASFTIQDNSDNTKQAQFQLSGITTGTTRTYTLPNESVELAGRGSNTFTGAQVLSDQQVSRALLVDMGYTYLDKGNSSTTTQTLDYTAGSHQKVTATGNHTVATSNWPPTGNLGQILFEATNYGAYTITWPTINWIKPDGTTTTSIATYLTANTGRTALQSSGTDFILLWSRDAGTTIYGKLV